MTSLTKRYQICRAVVAGFVINVVNGQDDFDQSPAGRGFPFVGAGLPAVRFAAQDDAVVFNIAKLTTIVSLRPDVFACLSPILRIALGALLSYWQGSPFSVGRNPSQTNLFAAPRRNGHPQRLPERCRAGSCSRRPLVDNIRCNVISNCLSIAAFFMHGIGDLYFSKALITPSKSKAVSIIVLLKKRIRLPNGINHHRSRNHPPRALSCRYTAWAGYWLLIHSHRAKMLARLLRFSRLPLWEAEQ